MTTETCNLLNTYDPLRRDFVHTDYPGTFLDQTGGGQTVQVSNF